MGGAIYNANYGMGEPTYGLLLSLIASWRSRLVQHVLHRRFFEGSSLDARGCNAATLSRYYFILCESHGQRALNGHVLLLETADLT